MTKADYLPSGRPYSSNELDKLGSRDVNSTNSRMRTYLSYALFPQVATDFFKYRQAQQTKVDATSCRYRERSISGLKNIKKSLFWIGF